MKDDLSVHDALDGVVKILKDMLVLKHGEKYVVLRYKDSFVLVQTESKIVGALKVFMTFFKRNNITQDILPEMYEGSAYDITIRTIGRDV